MLSGSLVTTLSRKSTQDFTPGPVQGQKTVKAMIQPQADQMITARTHAGLTQEAVAVRMGTTKSAVSRLESSHKHAPSLATLKKYAAAVGCEIQVKLIPQRLD